MRCWYFLRRFSRQKVGGLQFTFFPLRKSWCHRWTPLVPLGIGPRPREPVDSPLSCSTVDGSWPQTCLAVISFIRIFGTRAYLSISLLPGDRLLQIGWFLVVQNPIEAGWFKSPEIPINRYIMIHPQFLLPWFPAGSTTPTFFGAWTPSIKRYNKENQKNVAWAKKHTQTFEA